MKITTDHDEIKKWVEQHRGRPQLLDDPEATGDKPILRIDFPGKDDDQFLSDDLADKYLTWDEFFRHFDAQELAFVYDEEPNKNAISWEYKFIKRNQTEGMTEVEDL